MSKSGQYIMLFGKYKGERLSDIPANYLLWLDDQDFCPKEVRDYVKVNRATLEREEKDR